MRAGRPDDLHRLLSADTPTGPGGRTNVWFAAHDRAGTLDEYLLALDLAAGAAQAAPDRHGGLGAEMRYALMRASVHTITNNLSPPLLRLLVEHGVWDVRRALSHARRLADPGTRHQALAGLVPHVPAEARSAVVGEALRAAEAITDPYSRAVALTGLASCVPPDRAGVVVDLALRAAAAITGEYLRAAALARLAPLRPVAEVLDAAFRAAVGVTDAYSRANALTGLAPNLRADQLLPALQAGGDIPPELALRRGAAAG
ncbi:hypothetical protein [Dactylosporangium sp. CA-139066]|uniref:hypothetical protein n=1 Tax=Dactylosporangium sp. CA-139066 TaxID=3239930 RepID=UPI003D8B96C5